MGKPAIPTRLDRPVILHLSADYPDSFRNRTTLAVRNLVVASPDFEHVVVSLKRQAIPWSTYLRKDPQVSVGRVFAFGYWGLPLGIGHFASMALVAHRIHALLAQEQIAPQVIHAHKLCFEGIVAWLLARRLGVPFVTSLRGEAETKIVRFKPSYRPLIKRVARDARIIFAVSMWFVAELKQTAPGVGKKIRPLPNLVPGGRAGKPIRVPSGHSTSMCIARKAFIGSFLRWRSLQRSIPT